MLKAAVVGVGAMGRNHARVFQELSNVTLVGVADSSENTAADAGRRFHVPCETDYRRLLDEYKPEIVAIAVPTDQHLAVAEETIARGIHVLIEKPITATVEQGRSLIDLARKANVRLGIGHIERFNPAIVELKKRLAAGQLGEIFRLHSRRMGPYPARIRDVGVVIDLASHDLDMLRYVLGSEVTRVYAETSSVINDDREDLVDCVARTQSGVVATLNVNWTTPAKVRELTVTGTQGMFLVNYLTQDLYFYENAEITPGQWYSLSVLTGVGEGNVTQLKMPRMEPLKAEIVDFVNAVLEGREPLVTGEDGLAALSLAQALLQSSREKRAIQLIPEN